MKFKSLAIIAAIGLWVGQAMAAEKEFNLNTTSYNAETKVLTVTFKDGKKYDYADVPQTVVDEMDKAESKGNFFNKNIRGKYKHSKVE